MKIKLVKKLRSREVNTKYGQRTVTGWVVSEEGQELTKIADLWQNENNRDLKEGDFIYGYVVKSGEYNGKEQFTIKTENASPAKREFQAKTNETHDLTKENNTLLKEILSILKGKDSDGVPF